jgi:hypothetical protein
MYITNVYLSETPLFEMIETAMCRENVKTAILFYKLRLQLKCSLLSIHVISPNIQYCYHIIRIAV